MGRVSMPQKSMMPEPKTAEEWAATCEGRTDEVGGNLLLCPACARAYARQQVEAWKENSCKKLCPRCASNRPVQYDEQGAFHEWQEPGHDGNLITVTDDCDAEDLRAVPVEPIP